MQRPVHQPYLTTKPFSIGLAPVDPATIIDVDGDLARDLAQKKALHASDEGAVFRAEAGTEQAQQEVLRLVLDCAERRYPELFLVDADSITVAPSSERHLIDDFADAPLKLAGMLVQEDLCLMRRGDDGWRLAAASVCFPSSWNLAEKFSRPLGAIHEPVPGFAGRMLTVVERIFDNLQVGQPVERYNWSLYTDLELRHAEPHSDQMEAMTVTALSEALTLRVERQTLTRLPVSGDILFTIRIHLDPLSVLRDHPGGTGLATGLKEQLIAHSDDQRQYKGLSKTIDAIAVVLDTIIAGGDGSAARGRSRPGRRAYSRTGNCRQPAIPKQSRRLHIGSIMDEERNRLTGRVKRYARVGTNMGGLAARMAGVRLFGGELDHDKNAGELAAALGNLKGPLMKVVQLLATIPDAIPPEYAVEFAKLQANAPPMGWAFVKRRMMAELGAGWQKRFKSFEHEPAAAASLGQVHKAVSLDGRQLACKLQYPDMESAVEADLNQLGIVFSIHRRMKPAIDTREVAQEIGARVREELDYDREARHTALYGGIFADEPRIRIPVIESELSTKRLLTMNWMDGEGLLSFKEHPLEERNLVAEAMFRAWWYPFSHYGVIHGDPHLGNYTVFTEDGRPGGINLLDYGCIRIFPSNFVKGVVELYRGLLDDDRDRIVGAYERWGFKGLTKELIDVLNIWAKFIYGPLLIDRVRSIADGVSPAEYGRREAFRVHQALKRQGPVIVPREFVFMDRAAIGLGGVFLHLNAELNFFRLFNEQIENFDESVVADRQAGNLKAVGLTA